MKRKFSVIKLSIFNIKNELSGLKHYAKKIDNKNLSYHSENWYENVKFLHKEEMKLKKNLKKYKKNKSKGWVTRTQKKLDFLQRESENILKEVGQRVGKEYRFGISTKKDYQGNYYNVFTSIFKKTSNFMLKQFKTINIDMEQAINLIKNEDMFLLDNDLNYIGGSEGIEIYWEQILNTIGGKDKLVEYIFEKAQIEFNIDLNSQYMNDIASVYLKYEGKMLEKMLLKFKK